jgi:hypothetical protein
LLNNDYSSNHENNAISIYPGFVFSTVTLANSIKGQKKLDTKVTISFSNLTYTTPVQA